MNLLRVSSLVFAVSLFATFQEASAQPGGGRGPQFGGGGGGVTDLLRDSGIRKELELVDDQIAKIEELGNQIRSEMQEVFAGFRGLRDLPEEERRAKMEEMQATMRAKGREVQERVEEVLLPHQRERLGQLMVQSRLRQGTARALGSEQMREALGLTEDQIEKLREASETKTRELEEKISKLREEARKEILEDVLTADQVARFEKMVGEPFEFQQQRQGFGGQRGGDGGRGRGGDGQGRGRPAAE